MSCYFRHIKDIVNEAGIQITPRNKKQLDQAIHEIVEVTYKDCPGTWRKLKQQIIDDDQKKQDLIEKLKDAVLL